MKIPIIRIKLLYKVKTTHIKILPKKSRRNIEYKIGNLFYKKILDIKFALLHMKTFQNYILLPLISNLTKIEFINPFHITYVEDLEKL